MGLIALGVGLALRWMAGPTYQVEARLMLTQEGAPSGGSTALLARPDDWLGLLTSSKVADGVVRKLTLFLQTDDDTDRQLLRGFTVDDSGFMPSKYQLAIDRDRQRWTVTAKPAGTLVDSGGAYDSLGLKWGLKWRLDQSAWDGHGTRTVNFTLTTPRLAAVDVLSRLKTTRKDAFLTLTFDDREPALAVNILNTWLRDCAHHWTMKLRRACSTPPRRKSRSGCRQRTTRSTTLADALAAPAQAASGTDEGGDGSTLEPQRRAAAGGSRDVAAALDTKIETQLAEFKFNRSTLNTPGFMILDTAIAPLVPMPQTGPAIVVSNVLAGIGLVLTVAILVDLARRGIAAYFRWVGDEEISASTLPDRLRAAASRTGAIP